MRTKLPSGAASPTSGDQFRPAKLRVELEPERGELDADVGAQSLLVDRLEGAAILVAEARRLLAEGHLLAEDVEGRLLPLSVEVTHDVACLGEGRAGDVAAREPFDDRPGHRR